MRRRHVVQTALNGAGAPALYARVLEQVDRHVWGACDNRRGSSILLSRTKNQELLFLVFSFIFYFKIIMQILLTFLNKLL